MSDAVVQTTETELHLGSALNRVLEGTYCFRLKPIPPGNASGSRQGTLDWDRSTDPEGAVHLAGIQPGLYTIEKSGSEAAGACDFEADPTPAWILVASPASYQGLKSQWVDFTTQARKAEQEGASPTVLLTLRHAALAHLADSLGASGK